MKREIGQVSRKEAEKQNEVGRTMVEMFAVIVIISVLTLIGLGGFGMASNYLQGNRISQAVLQESALLLSSRKYAQMHVGDTLAKSATGIETVLPDGASYKIKKIGNPGFAIQISGLKEGVCRRAATLTAVALKIEAHCDEGWLNYHFIKGEQTGGNIPAPGDPDNPDEPSACSSFNCDGVCMSGICCPRGRVCSSICCDIGEECQSGVCGAVCAPACGAGEICQDGQCIADCDPACQGGSTCQKGVCICPKTGLEVCGSTCCPAGQECVTDDTGAQSCGCLGNDSYWNGTACVTCEPPREWTGSACVCQSGLVWSGDDCVECVSDSDCSEGGTCNTTTNVCEVGCKEPCGGTCCPAKQMCSSDVGGCVDVTGCKSNADCWGNAYCKISATQNTSLTSCYKDYSGTCEPKGTLPKGVDINKSWTVWKGPALNWWSARNWCAAHGKRLISKSELKCNYFSNGSKGYCCKYSGTCSSTSTQSELMQALRNKLRSGYFWTSTSYDSCSAFYVDLSPGFVTELIRNYNTDVSALCEEES